MWLISLLRCLIVLDVLVDQTLEKCRLVMPCFEELVVFSYTMEDVMVVVFGND